MATSNRTSPRDYCCSNSSPFPIPISMRSLPGSSDSEQAAARKAWRNGLELAGIDPALGEPILARLVDRYREGHRAYHTASHVADLIGQAGAFEGELANPAAVTFAIWYHDAIYRPRRSDNEAESAGLAGRELTGLGARGDLIEVVVRLIEATQRHQPPTGLPDAALFLDSDLAILGSPPPVYAAYRAAIRREYRWVPAPIYRRKRAEVLTAFLERERIYLTQRYRPLEEPARANLAAEIAGG